MNFDPDGDQRETKKYLSSILPPKARRDIEGDGKAKAVAPKSKTQVDQRDNMRRYWQSYVAAVGSKH